MSYDSTYYLRTQLLQLKFNSKYMAKYGEIIKAHQDYNLIRYS